MKSLMLQARSLEVEDLTDIVTFLLGDCTPEDEVALRSMIVWGASRDQIVRALAIAGVKPKIKRADKLIYTFGVVKNLMLEDKP